MPVKIIKSYMESVIDPPQNELNPSIWDGTKLKDAVRKELLKPIEDMKIPNVKRIAFVGSNTGFQYTNSSDIDVHIWIPGISEEEIEKFKQILPKDLKLSGTDHPIQYYVVSVDETQGFEGKGAMYDLEKDEWIIKPEKSDVKVPYSYLMSMAKFFIEGIENRIREYESDKKELEHLEKELSREHIPGDKEDIEKRIEIMKQEIESDIDALVIADDVLYGYRSDSYTGKTLPTELQMGSGNESTQNAVFKIIEEMGTRQRMKDIINTRKK